MQERLADFDVPWCQEIIKSPDYTQLHLPNRRPPPPLDKTITNTLFTETLRTESTIPAWLALQSREIRPTSASPEYLLLLSLGTGLDGHKAIAHGGFSGLIMDQLVNMCVALSFGPNWFSAESRQKFIRPMPLPSLALCRAVATKVDGRRISVSCSLEDGQGTVYCEGGTVCVRRSKSNKAKM